MDIRLIMQISESYLRRIIMRKTRYATEIATVILAHKNGSEDRLERLFIRADREERVRFSWWKKGKFMTRPLDLPEGDLLKLLRKGASAGVFTDRFLAGCRRLRRK